MSGSVNPEANSVVAVYRRVVPVAVRRGIADRLPLEVRSSVKDSAAAVAAARARALVRLSGGHGRAKGRHSAAAVRCVVWHQGRTVRAERSSAPVAWEVQARAFDRVVDALETARVPHFAVRSGRSTMPVVAVPAPARGMAEEALRAALTTGAGYVGPASAEGRDMSPADAHASWRRLRGESALRVAWYVCDPAEKLVLGADSGIEVEFWAEEDGELVAPRANRVITRTPGTAPLVTVGRSLFTSSRVAANRGVTTLAEFASWLPEDHQFPVDVVYTWVDDSDPAWRAARDRARGQGGGQLHEQAANDARFTSHDELRYSLRSIHQFAPWVRRVFLVTAGQRPAWLNTDHPDIQVVDHREIFSEPAALPTFNSHAIESQLHHIDGLAEHFLYLNDDVVFGRLVSPELFFHSNGLTKFFPSNALIPHGGPGSEDVPVNAAGKNTRGLIARHFGTVISQKMKHTPHALRRSVLAEIERVYADDHRRTQFSRFRSPGDLSTTSSLHHYYAYHTARATIGRIRYDYVDLSDRVAQLRMNRILAARSLDTFCVNDTVITDDRGERGQALRAFLAAYFPVPSPYELPGGTAPVQPTAVISGKRSVLA